MPYNTGDILLDKYRIEEQIGKGAFGEVYRVTHLKLNAPRALKVLRRDAPGLGSTEYGEYQDRFKLEAQLGAKLNHSNIIQVHDFEMDGDDLLLVMEYAAGGNLSKRIEQSKQGGTPMPLESALAIAQEVAAGLAKLHELDVVHRDLKPSNILFDEKGHAKVADFGLAQTPGGPSMRSQLSDPPPHPGTPAYMSPEQRNTKDYLTSASDVYALGLVLFEMLTGRVYRSQRPGTRAASLREDVPAWLDDLLVAMLSETPESRPWDGKEVLEKLQDGLQVEEEKRKAEKRARQAALDKARQEKAQQRADEIARLSKAAQAAIWLENWGRARQSIEELEKLGETGEAIRLQKRLSQAKRASEEKAQRENEERKRLEAEEQARQENLKKMEEQRINFELQSPSYQQFLDNLELQKMIPQENKPDYPAPITDSFPDYQFTIPHYSSKSSFTWEDVSDWLGVSIWRTLMVVFGIGFPIGIVITLLRGELIGVITLLSMLIVVEILLNYFRKREED